MIGLVRWRQSAGDEAQLPRHDESRSEKPALDHRAVGAHVYLHSGRGWAGFRRGGAPRPRTGVRRLVRSLAEGRGGASRRSSEVVRDGRKQLDDGGKLSTAGPAEEVLPGERLCIVTRPWGWTAGARRVCVRSWRSDAEPSLARGREGVPLL